MPPPSRTGPGVPGSGRVGRNAVPVAARTASGQVAYQGWKTGAQRTVAARARPAPGRAPPARARHQSTTRITASSATPITRVTGTASTPVRNSTVRPTAVDGEPQVTLSPLRDRPATQPKPRPDNTDNTTVASAAPPPIAAIGRHSARSGVRGARSGACGATAARTANGSTTTAVALTATARPSTTPPATSQAGVRREATRASPATIR